MALQFQPIVIRTFSFSKSALSDVKVFAGIDRGCSLTKVIYVDKAECEKVEDPKCEFIILTTALFSNNKFEESLLWLKAKAYFPENKEYPLHVTGAGGVKYKAQIQGVLERDVIFADEFMSQSRGAYYMIKYSPTEDVTFPEVNVDTTPSINAAWIRNTKYQFESLVGKKKDIKCTDDLLPCIFVFMGSGGGYTYIGKDGTYHLAGGMQGAGKTFVGLCRVVIGTNDYEEITEMASRGDRRNVDTVVKDIIPEDNPYGSLPSSLPILYLGKLAKTNKSIEDFRKEDIAHSIVSYFMYNCLLNALYICMSENVSTVFFGGNLFQAEIFRKECAVLQKTFGIDFINTYFVTSGHTGALGAMISSSNDTDKFMK